MCNVMLSTGYRILDICKLVVGIYTSCSLSAVASKVKHHGQDQLHTTYQSGHIKISAVPNVLKK